MEVVNITASVLLSRILTACSQGRYNFGCFYIVALHITRDYFCMTNIIKSVALLMAMPDPNTSEY